MMTREEFIKDNLGKPWVNRGAEEGSHDCWSLVVAYFRDVKGIDLPSVSGFSDGSCDITGGYVEQVEHWREDDDGIVFMAFINGVPAHVGLRFGRHVLHAVGGPNGGQVCYHTVRLLKRWHSDVKFYTFKDQ